MGHFFDNIQRTPVKRQSSENDYLLYPEERLQFYWLGYWFSCVSTGDISANDLYMVTKSATICSY